MNIKKKQYIYVLSFCAIDTTIGSQGYLVKISQNSFQTKKSKTLLHKNQQTSSKLVFNKNGRYISPEL